MSRGARRPQLSLQWMVLCEVPPELLQCFHVLTAKGHEDHGEGFVCLKDRRLDLPDRRLSYRLPLAAIHGAGHGLSLTHGIEF
jgi:hypothetical protein